MHTCARRHCATSPNLSSTGPKANTCPSASQMRKTSGHESYISAILSDFVIHSFLYSPTTTPPHGALTTCQTVRCVAVFLQNCGKLHMKRYKTPCLKINGVNRDCRQLPPIQRGPVDDTVISHTSTRFMASYSRHWIMIGCQRPCDRSFLWEVIRRHFHGPFAGIAPHRRAKRRSA